MHLSLWRHKFTALPGNGSRQRSRAQSLVEMALITPIMLLLLIGALDIGRLFYYDIIVGNAVREGARRAIDVNYSNADIQSVVMSSAGGLTVTGITINPSSRTTTYVGPVSVTATYSMVVFTPGISSLIGSPKAIVHSATMKML